VRMGPPRRMVSGGPATDWARAGIAFAAHVMMADDAEAVPTYFRKSRRDPKASKIAYNGFCIKLPPLGLILQKLQQFGAFGQAGNFWLWHSGNRREGGCLATIGGVSGHWAPIASAGAPQDRSKVHSLNRFCTVRRTLSRGHLWGWLCDTFR